MTRILRRLAASDRACDTAIMLFGNAVVIGWLVVLKLHWIG